MLSGVLGKLHHPDIVIILDQSAKCAHRRPVIRAAVVYQDKLQLSGLHLFKLLHRLLDNLTDCPGRFVAGNHNCI